MSTKIYSGLKVVPAAGRTVFDIAADMREQMRAVARDRSHQILADRIIDTITAADYVDQTYVQVASRAMLPAARDDDPTSLSIVLTKGRDHLLAIPFGGDSLEKHLLSTLR